MTLRTLKIILIASAVLMSAAMVLAFLAAPYIGSAYLMVLEPAGSEFSRLTSDFALPIK